MFQGLDAIMAAMLFGGGRGGHSPLILKNSDFLVFLPTKFCIFHILPPSYEVGQNCAPPPLEKTEMTSLNEGAKLSSLIIHLF